MLVLGEGGADVCLISSCPGAFSAGGERALLEIVRSRRPTRSASALRRIDLSTHIALERPDETYRISSNEHGPVQSNLLRLSSQAPSPWRRLGSYPRARSNHAALIELPREGEEGKGEPRDIEARIPR